MSNQSEHSDDGTTEEWNPYQTPNVVSKPSTVFDGWKQKPLRLYRIGAVLQCLTILIGVPLACWDIESILGSGPSLFGCGLLSATAAYRAGFRLGILFGASGLLMTFGCFVLINAMNWGPSEAQAPVSGLAVLYGFVFGTLGAWTLFSTAKDRVARQSGPSESSTNTPPVKFENWS